MLGRSKALFRSDCEHRELEHCRRRVQPAARVEPARRPRRAAPFQNRSDLLERSRRRHPRSTRNCTQFEFALMASPSAEIINMKSVDPKYSRISTTASLCIL